MIKSGPATEWFCCRAALCFCRVEMTLAGPNQHSNVRLCCDKSLRKFSNIIPPKVYPRVFFGRNYSLLMSEIIFLYMAYILTREI